MMICRDSISLIVNIDSRVAGLLLMENDEKPVPNVWLTREAISLLKIHFKLNRYRCSALS